MSHSDQLRVSVALLGAALAIILRLRFRDQLTRDTARLTYQLEFPRGLTIQQVTDFLHALSRLRPSRGWLFGRDSVVFELVARRDVVEYRLRLPEHQADALLRQLRAVAPGIRTNPVEHPSLPRPNWLRRIHLTTTSRPLRTEAPTAFAAGLISSLQPLGTDETLLYQLVVYPVRTPQATAPTTQSPSGLPPWLRRIGQLLAGAPPPIYDRQALAAFKAKVASPWFGVVGTVAATAASKGRAHLLVGRLMATLHHLDQDGAELVPRWLPARAAKWLARAATRMWAAIYLNACELANVMAWPLGAPALPGLSLAGGRALPPAADLPASGRILGTATYGGLNRPVAVTPEDPLHQLVTGPTGSGKSTLLLGEIVQDMQAGRGVILIDPGGDLARDVVDRIPAHRVGDLIYLDATAERPIGLNPLACAPADVELVADQVLELIHNRNESSWGPRLEELLRMSLVLLAAAGMTLVELPAVLTDSAFRAGLLARLDLAFTATVGEAFARFNDWGDGELRGQAVSAVLNKVSPLTDRRRLRAMVGQAAPPWTMREVIEEGKILVVALPSGLIGGEVANLLGALVVQMVWNAALRRTELPRNQRRPITLYLDEAARFLRSGADLGDMLARARGHGLELVAALQHLRQASRPLQSALLSEARTKVSFQPGPGDATTLAQAFGPLVHRDDFLTLEPYTALAVIAHGGQVSPPVTIATHTRPEPTGWGPAALTASNQTYGRDEATVRADIERRRRLPAAAEPSRLILTP